MSNPNTIPITLSELLGMLEYTKNEFNFDSYFIPEVENNDKVFLIVNSGNFLLSTDIKEIPKGYSMPMSICDFLLKRKGFSNIDLITDNHWKKVTAYKFASKEELEKILFKKHDAKIVNNLIMKGDSELHVPNNIIAEIFEKRNRRLNSPSGTDWNKFRLLFGTKPKVIISNLLKNYVLKRCIVCKKINRELYITKCCKNPLCPECMKNEICPKFCNKSKLVVEKASTLRQIFNFNGDNIDNEISRIKEKMSKLEKRKNYREAEFDEFLKNISNEGNEMKSKNAIVIQKQNSDKNEDEKSKEVNPSLQTTPVPQNLPQTPVPVSTSPQLNLPTITIQIPKNQPNNNAQI